MFLILSHPPNNQHTVRIFNSSPLALTAKFTPNKILNWHCLGLTPLRLIPFPGQLGGVVAGRIAVNSDLPRYANVAVTLASKPMPIVWAIGNEESA